VDIADDVVAAEGSIWQLSHYDDVDEVFYDSLIHFLYDLRAIFFNYRGCHKKFTTFRPWLVYMFLFGYKLLTFIPISIPKLIQSQIV
jgi:hypothetical protein